MRIHTARIKGFGTYRDECALDLDAIDGKVVAVCGENGEGKSLLLSLITEGAISRSLGSQGTLKSRATERDSLLEVDASFGSRRYKLRHLQDAVSGAGEAVVTTPDGVPEYDTSKLTAFKSWAAAHLPDLSVLRASQFNAQQSVSAIEMGPADRMSLVLRAVGADTWELRAKMARKRAEDIKLGLDRDRARLADNEQQGGTRLTKSLYSTLAEQRKTDDIASTALATARAELATAEQAERDAESERARVSIYVRSYDAITARINSASAAKTEAAARVEACGKTLAREGDIRGAADQLRPLTESLATLDTRAKETAAALHRETLAHEELKREAADIGRRRDAIPFELKSLAPVLSQAKEIEAADIGAAEALCSAAKTAVTDAESQLAELVSTDCQSERIATLRDGIVQLSETDAARKRISVAARLLNDDTAAELSAGELPRLVSEQRAAIVKLSSAAGKVCDDLAGFRFLTNQRGALDAAKTRSVELGAELDRVIVELSDNAADTVARDTAMGRLSFEVDEIASQQRSIYAQIAALKPLADQLPHIEIARARLVDRREQLLSAEASLSEARAQLMELGDAPPIVADVPSAAPLRAAAAVAEKAARNAQADVAVTLSQIDAAEDLARRTQLLIDGIKADETELGDWQRLADDCGRKRIQAAEIDGAGPELTAYTNRLLHHCYGPRYSVRVTTQRLDAKGKAVDGCFIDVIDSREGREDDGKLFSGGQRTIVSEPFALALTALSCKRHNLSDVTLVRDETGGTLSPKNARLYLEMLREAVELIGASKVLFVSHSPEISKQADATITVAGGRIEVKQND